MNNVRLTNSKLSKIVLDKLIINNISAYGIDFMLYLSIRQDALGHISNVHVEDVMEHLSCSKQTFYNVLSSLEKHKIIETKQNIDGYWDIEILDNRYMDKNDDKKQYINTNKYIFSTNTFKNYKAKEKLLVIKLLMMQQLQKNKSFKIYINKLKAWLGIKTSNVIFTYLNNIKEFFKYTIVKVRKVYGTLIMVINSSHRTHAPNDNKEIVPFFKHFLKMLCKKNKVSYSNSSFLDTLKQICKYVKKLPYTLFIDTIHNTILQYDELQPAFINSRLTNAYARYRGSTYTIHTT